MEAIDDETEEGAAAIERWFSERRLKLLMKDAAQRERTLAAADRTLKEDEAELVITRLVDLCTPLVSAMRQGKLTAKQRCVALLQSKQMGGICASGSMAEVRSRIYEYREFIISTFELNKHDVYTALEAPDELRSRTCDVCNVNDFDILNPLILCDGCNGCLHIMCQGLEYVPHGDWLCRQCVDSGLYLIDTVLDKRTHQGCVEYLIRWTTGSSSSDVDIEKASWQRVSDIPRGRESFAMEKITEFNRSRAGK